MATVGSVLVNLSMGTASFAAGAAKASSIADKLGGSIIGSLTNPLQHLSSLLNTVSSVASSINEVVQVVDKIGDKAANIGIAADQLAKLHYAAQLTGSSAEAVDTGIGKMVQTIGDAARGGKDATAALQAIGLNAFDLAAMNPAQAFVAISDGLKKVDNDAIQTSVAMDIFGKGGKNMLELLRQGSTNLNVFAAEATASGFALGNMDFKVIGELADMIDRARMGWQAFKNQLLAGVAPVLTDILKSLSSAKDGTIDFGEVALYAMRIAAVEFAKVEDSIDAVIGKLSVMKTWVEFVNQPIIKVASGIKTAVEKLGLVDLLPEKTHTEKMNAYFDEQERLFKERKAARTSTLGDPSEVDAQKNSVGALAAAQEKARLKEEGEQEKAAAKEAAKTKHKMDEEARHAKSARAEEDRFRDRFARSEHRDAKEQAAEDAKNVKKMEEEAKKASDLGRSPTALAFGTSGEVSVRAAAANALLAESSVQRDALAKQDLANRTLQQIKEALESGDLLSLNLVGVA